MKLNIKRAISNHAPEILVGLGIAGFAGTIIFAIKTTPKAEKLIKESNAKTFKEKTKATWKVWGPVVGSAMGSAGLIICGAVKYHKKNTALMALAAATETAFSNYRNVVLDKVDPEKMAEIKADFQEHMKEQRYEYPAIDKEVYSLKAPEILCREEYSGRYFMGRRRDIEDLCVELGRQLNGCFTSMEYNEFLYGVGLSESEAGKNAGWISGDRIKPCFNWGEAPDGGPLLIVGFNNGPHEDYKEQF